LMVFGPYAEIGAPNVWFWDGSTWTSELVPTQPPYRFEPAIAWDVARDVAVLHGGVGDRFIDETWTWSGAAWAERSSPGGSPSYRLRHAMAYDPLGEEVLLFGGAKDDEWYYPEGDAWTWDGAGWME